MADGHVTSDARARKRRGDVSFFDDESPITPTSGPSRPPAPPACSFAEVFAPTSGPRAAAPYERFVDRHIVESLRAFVRGALRRVGGERDADLSNASAAKSLGKHRKLNRTLDQIVRLRAEDVTTRREAKRWSACGRALRALFNALRCADVRVGRLQRAHVRAALRRFEAALLPATLGAQRGRPAGRRVDDSFAAMAIAGAKRARARLNGQKPGREDARRTLREMENAFATAFESYFIELDGQGRAAAKLDAVGACIRPALYEMVRARGFPTIRELEAKRPRNVVADGATLAIYFVARWYGIGQKTAKRAMRGAAIQVRRILDRVVVRESEHSRAHESTHPADAERARRAPNCRPSRAPPQHDPPSVRRAPRPLADRRANRESSASARAP